MNYGLKVLLKDPFHYFKSAKGRMFLRLCSRFGNVNRFEKRTISLSGKPFTFVDSWSFLWQFYDIFYRESYYFTTVNEKPVIIDCGGNVGTSVLYFKQIHPEAIVECFEVDPDVFKILKANTGHLNGVNLYHQAVWSHNNGIKMELDHADGAHESETGIDIPSRRLKDVLNKFEYVDLVKMDIEGAEFEVLRDAKDSLSHVQRLFVEIHTFQNQKQGISEILQIVENAGFRYYMEQASEQKRPLDGNWKIGSTGMDVQINLYCARK